MKARKVKGLDPDGRLDDNIARMVGVRLDEVLSFGPKVVEPSEVQALHDLRIASKRLRYLLELFHPQFGPYAETAAKRAKDLQDLLGEIHDCDVTLPRVEGLEQELRERDAEEVRGAGGDAPDLDPALMTRARHGEGYRGLASMAVYLRARRGLLYDRFLELWEDLHRQGFDARLRFALRERPASKGSQLGNGSAGAEPLPSTDAPA